MKTSITNLGGGRAVIARAFTLIEILISIAAMALIAVGLATIFGAIGRTVTAGRSVSAYTSYAALIERQMRADFASMSRDFPLVIRNELTGDGLNIPLYPADIKPRPRRIDEIIFGVKGRFASAREPLYPGYTARGDSARIYYGHGQRRIVDDTPNSAYLRPALDDTNADPQAGVGVLNNVNPNRYPSDWTLLRHVTVFSGPTTTLNDPPPLSDGVVYPDNEIQVGLQPAASSPFRRLGVTLPDSVPQNAPYNKLIRDPVRPQFPGGIVDVVTSDFSEVRSIVNTVDFQLPLNDEASLLAALASGKYTVDPNGNYPASLRSMHNWMDELFPTWSMAQDTKDRVRMRYEPAAPDYFAPLTQSPYYADPNGIKGDWGRADQVMLSSSNFLPHCSEFIVEWSFGKVWAPLNPQSPGWDADQSGKVIWHGLTRPLADDPVKGLKKGQLAHIYDPADAVNGIHDEFRIPYRRNDGALGEYLITKRRIHGLQFVVPPGLTAPLTSYFGYTDPQFSPDRNNNNSVIDPDDAVSSSIDWAWPKLIRITISLADPNDPSVEQTFQFVFDAPGNQTR